MPEKWTGKLIGEMHNARVTADDLAKEIGCSKGYISMILNGRRTPVDAQAKLETAFNSIIERRKGG